MRFGSLVGLIPLLGLALPAALPAPAQEPLPFDSRPGVAHLSGEPEPAATEPTEPDGLAIALNDFWITAVVKARLLRDTEVPGGGTIDVDAKDGVVTLFGMVPTQSAQAAAMLTVIKTDGVRRVENLLEVVPEARLEVTRTHDRALATSIEERLAQRSELAATELDVAVCNAVARLQGRLPSERERAIAVQTARQIEGVRAVVDQLDVEQRASS